MRSFNSPVLILAALTFIAVFSNSTVHAQNACVDAFKSLGADSQAKKTSGPESIQLFSPRSKVAAPESLSLVKKLNQALDARINAAKNGKSYYARIYRAALTELTETRALGEAIVKNQAASQKEVFDFAMKFSRLVDLPVEVADAIGYYADGFAYVHRYTEAKLKERIEGLAFRYSQPEKFFDLIVQSKVKALRNRLGFNLEKPFEYITLDSENIPARRFAFQYKYIFADGLLTIRNLIEERESGIMYAGISRRADNEFDGQQDGAVELVRHDILHAFTQKHYDAVLFETYGVKNLREAKALKATTNRLLRKRLTEMDQIKDPKLRKSVELMLFALLHEQAQTYPLGVVAEANKSKEARYVDGLKSEVDRKQYGPDYEDLVGHGEALTAAWKWVTEAAKADLKELDAKHASQ